MFLFNMFLFKYKMLGGRLLVTNEVVYVGFLKIVFSDEKIWSEGKVKILKIALHYFNLFI